MANFRKVTPELRADILSGKYTCGELCDKHGVCRQTVRRVCNSLGVSPKPIERRAKVDVDPLVALYRVGWSIKDLSVRYGISEHIINLALYETRLDNVKVDAALEYLTDLCSGKYTLDEFCDKYSCKISTVRRSRQLGHATNFMVTVEDRGDLQSGLRILQAQGYSLQEIAKIRGVSRQAVSFAINREKTGGKYKRYREEVVADIKAGKSREYIREKIPLP